MATRVEYSQVKTILRYNQKNFANYILHVKLLSELYEKKKDYEVR